MNYYERHLGDYARDTAHLSMMEHGAYTVLLDRFYATEQGIPADQVHRIARARTKEERAAVDVVLAEFFALEEGAYVQKRALAEIVKAQARIQAARENGRTGGRPRRNPEGTRRKPAGFSDGTQSKALQTPDSKHQTPEEGGSLRSPSGALEVRTAISSDFEQFLEQTYPPTSHRCDWITASKSAQAIVGMGRATEVDLRRRVTGYRAFVDSRGVSDPSKVASPQSWFRLHDPAPYWAKEWAAVPSKAQQQQDSNIDAAQAFLNRRQATA